MKKAIKYLLWIFIIILLLAYSLRFIDNEYNLKIKDRVPALFEGMYTAENHLYTKVYTVYTGFSITNIENLLPHTDNAANRRYKADINTIVVHHDGVLSATFNHAPVLEHAIYHTGHNQWSALAYHYYIDSAGKVYQCNPLNTVTGHTTGYNRTSVGICLQGNFNFEIPTEAQKTALRILIRLLKAMLNIKSIYRHDELNDTDCPGQYFNINLK